MIPDKVVMFGVIIVFIGVLLIVLGSVFSTAKGKDKASVKSAGIVFIGPIPFGWASDKQTFYALLAFAVVILSLWFFFFRR